VLAQAKKGTVFVNISRGEISPSGDLKRLLMERTLGGVALDIYQDEPVLAEFLRKHDGPLTAAGKAIVELKDDERVLFTPHNAFNTREALERKAQQTCQSISQFAKTRRFPHPVPSN
jgi:D-lactate dehydrogenase